jgi:twitching motility protein PilT
MREHEVVLGVGRQKSIRNIVDIAAKDIGRTQGVPRRVTLSHRGIVVVAEREDFEGAFTHFTSHFGKMPPKVIARIEEAVTKHSAVCTFTTDGDHHELQCESKNGATNETIFAAVDEVSQCFKLPEVWSIWGDRFGVEPLSMEKLFKAMIQYKASDCHMCPGEQPLFRVDNDLHRSDVYPELSSPQLLALIEEISTERYWEEFKETQQTSFNFHQVGLGYSRVSAFIKAGAPHCTIRFLPETIPSFTDLNLPNETLEALAKLRHGMVMITGMTGSGKSTTVAALVDWINTNRMFHILTIENPVEYVHRNKKSMVSQRDTGVDVATFNDAVTGALRHDPDVVVIGEMRDPDTIRSAINAAATGHLVITTLHASTAYDVVARICSFFDPVERDLVRLQLQECIECIICQRLLPREGGGRIPAIEVLLNDVKAVNDGIRSGDSDVIRIGMQQSTSHSIIFEKYIYDLYKAKKININVAHDYSTDSSILDQMIMGTYTVPRLESIKHMGAQA